MFKRVAESKSGRVFVKWYEKHGGLKILVRCFAFDRAQGFGGIVGGAALTALIWYQNNSQLDKLETTSSNNLKKAELCYKNMKKNKENLLDCESVKAVLSPHRKKKSVKQEGLLIMVVEKEEEKGEDGRKGSYGVPHSGDGSYHGGRRDQDRRGVHMAPPQRAHPPPARVILPKPVGVGPSLSPPPECPFAGSMRFDMSHLFYVSQVSPIIKQAPPSLFNPSLPPSMVKQIYQDKEVRRQDNWRKWIHTSGGFAADSGSSAPVASTDSSLLNVSLNESATSISSAPTDAQVKVAAGGGLSDESTNQSKPAQEEGTAEVISTNHT